MMLTLNVHTKVTVFEPTRGGMSLFRFTEQVKISAGRKCINCGFTCQFLLKRLMQTFVWASILIIQILNIQIFTEQVKISAGGKFINFTF